MCSRNNAMKPKSYLVGKRPSQKVLIVQGAGPEMGRVWGGGGGSGGLGGWGSYMGSVGKLELGIRMEG